MLLESDQKLVDALPQDIRDRIDGCCEEFVMQVSIAWDLRDQPLPEGFIPEMVDVFVDGSEEACLYIYQGKVKFVEKEFFGDRDKGHFVIMINEEARYVELNGELVANSLGGCILPDVITSPAAQLSCLSSLLED